MKRFLAVAIVIPVLQSTSWKHLEFKKIPPNKVEFNSDGLSISVQNSASPLIYPLDEKKLISKIRATIRLQGLMSSTTQKFPEDFYLRIGLVASGTKRLNAVQRLIAAPWVKELHNLAPAQGGIDRIYFFGIAGAGTFAVGDRRFHPKSDLMEEIVIAKRDRDSFEIDYVLPKPIETVAVWLAADGDDSKSKFVVQIQKLELLP